MKFWDKDLFKLFEVKKLFINSWN